MNGIRLDPEPWVMTFNGVADLRTAVYKPRFENGFGQIVIRLFVPRAGYSRDIRDYQ